ncbi:LacI family DNA-binding transcriptional regulator [Geminisphaera colitermitum]|uniref:substrate-binding domain-containing protein n=1 Tax=Geminisphaera colitermitum TaxID=1148786 RepID=UPI000158CC18|nr:LacI family DNA-binding transcriptional regulator [Geminisphaera colitermitum]
MAAFSVRLTQIELARQLGLSQATVSRALKGSLLLPKDTIRRVREAAEASGYRPDPGLASLVAYRKSRNPPGKGQCLAWLMSKYQADLPPHRTYPEHILDGARQRAHQLGYRLETFFTDAPDMTPQRLSRMLAYRRVEGIILAPHVSPGTELPLILDDFSTVAIGHTVHIQRIDRVAHNHFESMLIVCSKLRERGLRRIGLGLPPHSDMRSHGLWKAAFLLDQTTTPKGRHIPVLGTEETDAVSLRAWFTRWRPDALILHLANSGARLEQLKALGVRWPEDVSVALLSLPDGYEHFSGINERTEELGAFSVEALVSRIQNNQRGVPELPRMHMIEGSWQEGTTCRKRK